MTLAVENVAGTVGNSASGEGNRDATISAGDGVEDPADSVLKLISRLGCTLKPHTMKQANTSLRAFAERRCTMQPPPECPSKEIASCILKLWLTNSKIRHTCASCHPRMFREPKRV